MLRTIFCRLSALLRSKECELIIALTHMRAPNDERLAREAEDIDIILGGHDHEYFGVKRIGQFFGTLQFGNKLTTFQFGRFKRLNLQFE